MADEIGIGLIGTMLIGGSGSGALPGTFTTASAVTPVAAVVSTGDPNIRQVLAS